MVRKILIISIILLSLTLGVLWFSISRPLISPPVRVTPRHDEARANAENLRADTHKLSTTFFPRDYRHPENLDQAAEWIAEEFKKSGQKVWMQEFQVGGKRYSNVIAESKAPGNLPRDSVVIGAHYDACGEYPAADDNASGVAGLLELSRLLSRIPLTSDITLVAYTLEEPPFFRTENMGSAVHAHSLVERGDRIRLMISLEMIGFFSDEVRSQTYPHPLLELFYPSIGNFIAVVGPMTRSQATRDIKAAILQATNLPAFSMNAPAWVPGIDFSDHLNYWNAGFDAVMVTDTSFFRNHAYHTPHDTYERLDYGRMSEVVTGVFSYLKNLGSSGDQAEK